MFPKMIRLSAIILLGFTIYFCNNDSLTNDNNSTTSSNVTWKSSGCIPKDMSSINKTAERTASIYQSDSGTLVDVSITTYCATEFVCNDKIIHDTIEFSSVRII
jgi:hypothetical protein